MPSGLWTINQLKDRISLPEVIKKHGAGMVMVLGHLTSDPESRTVGANSLLKAYGGLAVNFGSKKEDNETVEFYNWCAWRESAEQMMSLSKGSAVLLIGKAESRTWQGKDGEARESAELTVYSLALPVYRKKTFGGKAAPPPRREPEPVQELPEQDTDGIPF